MGQIPDQVEEAIKLLCERLCDEAIANYKAGIVGETIEDQVGLTLDIICSEPDNSDKNYIYKKTPLQ